MENNPDLQRSAIAAIPAFGLGIGAPAAVWTAVSIFGVAATGTRIGSLSGAAAGAATAAWIGRATGLGGMAAGRIVLGPIGVAASALTLPLGAAVAGNRERNYIRQTEDAVRKMACLEEVLGRARNRMTPLHLQMTETTANLQKHARQLETTTPNTPAAQDIVRELDIEMRKAVILKDELVKVIEELNDDIASSCSSDED